MGGNWYVEAKEDIKKNKKYPKQLIEIMELSGRLRDIAKGYLEKIVEPKSLKKHKKENWEEYLERIRR